MRSFKVIATVDGQAWTAIHVFADGQSKTVTADEFLSLMQASVGKTLSECTEEARDYLLTNILDEDAPLTSTVDSVEELDA